MGIRKFSCGLAVAAVLLASTGISAAEEDERVFADVYLDQLWVVVDIDLVKVTDADLRSMILDRKLAALYLPEREDPSAPEPVVYTCRREETRFQTEAVPSVDYEELLHFAQNPDSYAAGATVIEPASYEVRTRQVSVRPASVREELIPARYETRTKRVCVEPARREWKLLPPEYEERRSRVLVRAARTEWRRVPCPDGQLQEGETSDCCWMLVHIPPQYEERVSRVCVRPARYGWAEIPPQYEEVQEQVMVAPQQVKKIPIPAVYETVEEKVMVRPAVKRGVGMRFGPAFGEVQDAYWLPKWQWEGNEELRPASPGAWDDPEKELPTEWTRIGGVTTKPRAAPDLGSGTKLEGYLFVRGTQGAYGPTYTELDAGEHIIVDTPERTPVR